MLEITMHDNEIVLTFKSTTGKTLPTRDYHKISATAKKLGRKYEQALVVQTLRQAEA
jgi:hypothetical protein